MKIVRITKPDSRLIGSVKLRGSKSISNRVLIIKALCDSDLPIHHLSEADDTKILNSLLNSDASTFNAGHAGTSFRFLTSYLCTRKGTQILTGSERMKQRPIGPLVDALRHIGADIEYSGKEGYPPLKIGEFKFSTCHSEVHLAADISSQFVSSLLLIAPILPKGLIIHLENEAVSRPYILMTLKIMSQFGIEYSWNESSIEIANQNYSDTEFNVESDWSAASYYFGLASNASEVALSLYGLFENSVQGDAIIQKIAEEFGVHASFDENNCLLSLNYNEVKSHFEHDFIEHPDLAQTVSVMCAALGIESIFSGLKTLRIKETDRIAALQKELKKVSVFLNSLPTKYSKRSGKEFFIQSGKAKTADIPRFQTYEDHRMAMALSLLAMHFPIEIEDPEVVNKSYPGYWDDLADLGFEITNFDVPAT
jgi:3-phosphoshikimate 1-carboxyvinyltransferase